MIRHAGLIAIRLRGFWKGALVEGPSGAGKSDLAIRALAAGFRVVADDRTVVWTCGGRLYGRAPGALSGLLEMRGLDVVQVSPLPLAEIVMVARLGQPERMPDPDTLDVLGIHIARLDVDPFAATAPAKLSRAIEAFDAAHKGRI